MSIPTAIFLKRNQEIYSEFEFGSVIPLETLITVKLSTHKKTTHVNSSIMIGKYTHGQFIQISKGKEVLCFARYCLIQIENHKGITKNECQLITADEGNIIENKWMPNVILAIIVKTANESN